MSYAHPALRGIPPALLGALIGITNSGCSEAGPLPMTISKTEPLGAHLGQYPVKLTDDDASPDALRQRLEADGYVRTAIANGDLPPFSRRLPVPHEIGIVFMAEVDGEYASKFARIAARDPEGFDPETLLWAIVDATRPQMGDANHIYIEGFERIDDNEALMRNRFDVPDEARAAAKAGLAVYMILCGS